MEDFIKRYPIEFLGEELTFVSQQRKISGFRTDLVFEDKDGSFVIVELQIEALDRSHFYRTLEYRDFLLEENENRRVRVMLVCNSVPEKFLKSLKIHNVECRVIEKHEFNKKVRLLEPGVIIRDKSKPRFPLTANSLLAELERKPKVQSGNSDILGFWLRNKEDSARESFAFNQPISARKVIFESFDGGTSLASGSNQYGEDVFVPKQLLIAAGPFIGRIERKQLFRISKWFNLFGRFGNKENLEFILGWDLPHDYLRYKEHQKPEAWQFVDLLHEYKKDTCYDETLIRKDLDWLASLKLYVGVYPNVTAIPPYLEYVIEQGAGCLYDQYLEWVQQFQQRVDPNILGPSEWLSVRFPKIDRTYFYIMEGFIKHLLHHHCDKFLNLGTRCSLCLISPRTLDEVDEKMLFKASRYFAFAPNK